MPQTSFFPRTRDLVSWKMMERHVFFPPTITFPRSFLNCNIGIIGRSCHKYHFCRDKHVAYWAVQAGLLTPLTFTRHRSSPLATLTSGVYFLHNGRRWQWICDMSWQNYACHNKTSYICHDKSMLVTNLCLSQQIFVMTKIFCHDHNFVATKLLSWQTYFCRDKNDTCGSSCQWYIGDICTAWQF